MQLRLSSQSIQVRPVLSQHRSPRLGGLVFHCAAPSYGRSTRSYSSKQDSNTPAPVTRALKRKPLTGASQNEPQTIGRNSNTTDSREPLPDLPGREWTPADMEEVLASSHHGLDNNSTFSTPWSYVKPDAPWGFVVYRAVYGKESEEPWKQILGLLRDTVTVPKTTQQPFPWLGPIQSDPQFELTVMEDEQRFAGADSHTIREAFREWVAGDLPSRVLNPAIEGGIDNIRAMIRSTAIGEAHEYGHGKPIHPWHIAPPRWSFCVLVDEICLRSLNRADGLCPVVKMVNLRFPEGRCESIAEGWEDGETEDPQEDVGWMYTYAHSYEVWYQVLSDPSNWDDEVWYMRPEKEEFPSANDVE